jgi:hypothetical protein
MRLLKYTIICIGISARLTQFSIHSFIQTFIHLEAFMAFHYKSKEEARAAIYDAAMLILQADANLVLPIGPFTIQELSELCRKIESGAPISGSPLLDI